MSLFGRVSHRPGFSLQSEACQASCDPTAYHARCVPGRAKADLFGGRTAGTRETVPRWMSASGQGFWHALAGIPGQAAVAAVWRAHLGTGTDPFPWLVAANRVARFVPCAAGCGCAHEVVRFRDGVLVAVCRCDSWGCPDVPMAESDVRIWELDRPKLARAMCRAFALRAPDRRWSGDDLFELGTWPSAPAPVFLAFCGSRGIAEVLRTLSVRVRRSFGVITPVDVTPDATTLAILSECGAVLISAESALRLEAGGELIATQSPDHLFAGLAKTSAAPGTEPALEQGTASKVFQMVKQMDLGGRYGKPSLLTVFRLYCVERLSADRIALRCGTSKGTVIRRLRLLHQRTGIAPAQLRQTSSYLQDLRDRTSDSRSRHIRAKALLDADEDYEES